MKIGFSVVFCVLLFSTVIVEAKSGCLMAGPIPCPPVANSAWWNGAWATRMQDGGGKPLTAFTLLKPNGKYVSTLEYDDGRTVQEWGHFQIEFPKGKKSISHVAVNITEEANDIGIKVETTNYRKSGDLINLMAAPLPSKGSHDCECAEGKITYWVEGSSLSPGSFASPQSFKFLEQAPGYVRVWGDGVDGKLSRQYAAP
ncbi:hypothetical protein [Rhizobium sp. NZLR1]|uniref:hypothetical protein n=1 Tax=Rhizobium sp. NZLR1 TaxID=2731096 RepID=UPI001A996DD9|nr:hypothetical protein [Rhizobium sp. NZLR1]MBX5201020.1 hypothetical protein [Rhizobium sp. NZLR1]QSZ21549.1 hypothetical protein J3O30_02980 [Rhizobium sp. NZLR1]